MTDSWRTLALTLLATLGVAANARASTVTISPLPGTPAALPATQISFLGAPASSLSAITVVGSRSGHHGGKLRSYASATGASFVPSTPFTPGERVTVAATLAASSAAHRKLTDSFTIAEPRAVSSAEPPTVAGAPAEVQSFQSRPELHPPAVTIDQPARGAAAPGDVFVTPSFGPGQHGPMIFDDAGALVWFDPLAEGESAADLSTQAFHGKNDLTWWQGHTLALGYGVGEDVVADANYKTVAIVRAGNGLKADLHEFTLTAQGAAYVLAYSPVQADLSSVGGSTDGVVLDCVVQEIDVHTGLVMWEWHSLGHIALAASHSTPPSDASTPFDYFHVDDVGVFSNGSIEVSARNTGERYQVDQRRGAVVRAMRAPPTSAFVDGAYSQALGDGARLTTDGLGNVSEASADGALLFAAHLPAGEVSYRALREPWSAQPRQAPAIAARASDGATAVYASWNGASTVDSWQLLAGSKSDRLAPISTTPKSGFETTIPAPNAAYVQVRALSASGKTLAASKIVQPASA
jgi:Arylsulfotransferase (ASST)